MSMTIITAANKFKELTKMLNNVRNKAETIPKWITMYDENDYLKNAVWTAYKAVRSVFVDDYPLAAYCRKNLSDAMENFADHSAMYSDGVMINDDGAMLFYCSQVCVPLSDYIAMRAAYRDFLKLLDETLNGKMNKENNAMNDLNLKDNLIFGYEDAFNRIVELVDDIMTWDKDELNINYILKRCKKFAEWTNTLHYPNEIWYKDVTDRAVDCVRGYLVGFDMTHVFGNFMNTVVSHSCDDDIPEEAGSPLRRLIHTLWVLTYDDKLDFNSIETRTVHYDSDLYQKEALRTENYDKDLVYPRILNGLMGLNGESGECIDILKKHLFQGHELDKEHLKEELGDVAWYLAVSADALGCKLSEIFEMNTSKLRKRYPDGFDAGKSANREDD